MGADREQASTTHHQGGEAGQQQQQQHLDRATRRASLEEGDCGLTARLELASPSLQSLHLPRAVKVRMTFHKSLTRDMTRVTGVPPSPHRSISERSLNTSLTSSVRELVITAALNLTGESTSILLYIQEIKKVLPLLSRMSNELDGSPGKQGTSIITGTGQVPMFLDAVTGNRIGSQHEHCGKIVEYNKYQEEAPATVPGREPPAGWPY